MASLDPRRLSREFVLQLLYAVDGEDQASSWKNLLENAPEAPPPGADLEMARVLYQGVTGKKGELDRLIQEQAAHWKLERMGGIERNLLRLGLYEILYEKDIPVSVSLNEALEIAKKFGKEDSAPFIHGILDGIIQKKGLH